jgi:hypothetical protein
MYAAHFAAGLAVKGHAPRAPLWALLTAAFLPDLLWIVLARAGVEPELPPRGFFDDWSHSLLMIVVWSSLFALLFLNNGRRAAAAVWVAGLSHLILDFPIHPARMSLYPHSSIRLGLSLWNYGQQKSALGPNHYWWIEAGFIVPLLTIYVWPSRRAANSLRLTVASSILIIGLHLLSA